MTECDWRLPEPQIEHSTDDSLRNTEQTTPYDFLSAHLGRRLRCEAEEKVLGTLSRTAPFELSLSQ